MPRLTKMQVGSFFKMVKHTHLGTVRILKLDTVLYIINDRIMKLYFPKLKKRTMAANTTRELIQSLPSWKKKIKSLSFNYSFLCIYS